jgi:hypothetical protein
MKRTIILASALATLLAMGCDQAKETSNAVSEAAEDAATTTKDAAGDAAKAAGDAAEGAVGAAGHAAKDAMETAGAAVTEFVDGAKSELSGYTDQLRDLKVAASKLSNQELDTHVQDIEAKLSDVKERMGGLATNADASSEIESIKKDMAGIGEMFEKAKAWTGH